MDCGEAGSRQSIMITFEWCTATVRRKSRRIERERFGGVLWVHVGYESKLLVHGLSKNKNDYVEYATDMREGGMINGGEL